MEYNANKGGITMENLRLALILIFTFCGGMVVALRNSTFSLEQEYDEDDERENEEELRKLEES